MVDGGVVDSGGGLIMMVLVKKDFTKIQKSYLIYAIYSKIPPSPLNHS